MQRDEGKTWPLIGGVVLLLGVAVLGGLALSNAGPAGMAVATQSNDTDWNTTNGSESVASGCPPADALRQEVFNALETRSIEEVRSTIPDDAVRCLPEDVRAALNLGTQQDDSTSGSDGNETDGTDSTDESSSSDDSNSTDGTDSTDNTDSTVDCPSPDVVRLEVDAALAGNSKAAVRAEFTDEYEDCLPDDVKDQLNIGDDSSGNGDGTDDAANDTSGDSTSGVDCPSDEEIRESVEMALADSSAATVRAQIPDSYNDCLPADVQSKLNMGANASAGSTTTEPTTTTGSDAGTETDSSGVDCPPAETIRKDVNKTLEKMSAAQFRTMVPDKYVECFPPDVRERLGLTTEAGASGGGDSQSAGGAETATDSSTVGGPDSELFDSDGDGVVNSQDYAPNNASVQYADSDGDGVPDPYDYAPRDTSVQEEGDAQAAAEPGGDGGGGDGGDGIPVAAGSALLLVLAAGTGAIVYRHYGGTGSDDDGLPQPAGSGSVMADEGGAEPHDVFGESAFDPDDSGPTGEEFTFDDHEGDDGGFVFDNDPADEDVITLDSDGSVPEAETETGFVFEGGPSPELDDAGEPADD